jgi:hypothetical protein
MRQGIQKELNDMEVREYGCYALCIIACAEHTAAKNLSDREILDIINTARMERWIGTECYVLEGAKLFNYVYGSLAYKSVIKSMSPPAAREKTYIVCNKKPMYTHFTAVLNDRPWDPLPPGRPGAAAYKPAGYRYFRGGKH